ncbi:hypothetical protein NC653_031203 [Populus alba x Populus x berolinensis]|uniref:R3H domain-containing protein n=1 Tax=Populus alba x Populus x berolinensis TaxID=444605 RepID=A0AAD6LXS7_9ROSI|nr:hypothetical protein NC653_031203 [Populus alba x Populus x berolinensis]
MEETFLNFLQDDSSHSDGILELQPMDAYSRLLLHRLADIFGFSHVSIGEGDDRHLILERCPETSIPSILVSDILFQFDEPHTSTTSHQLLRRKDAPPGSAKDWTNISFELSSVMSRQHQMLLPATSPPHNAFREREVAYFAARDRIFSRDVGEMREPIKEKPQKVLVVAHRMIAHALGQNTSLRNQGAAVRDGTGHRVKTKEQHVQEKGKIEPSSSSEAFQGIASCLTKISIRSVQQRAIIMDLVLHHKVRGIRTKCWWKEAALVISANLRI